MELFGTIWNVLKCFGTIWSVERYEMLSNLLKKIVKSFKKNIKNQLFSFNGSYKLVGVAMINRNLKLLFN